MVSQSIFPARWQVVLTFFVDLQDLGFRREHHPGSFSLQYLDVISYVDFWHHFTLQPHLQLSSRGIGLRQIPRTSFRTILWHFCGVRCRAAMACFEVNRASSETSCTGLKSTMRIDLAPQYCFLKTWQYSRSSDEASPPANFLQLSHAERVQCASSNESCVTWHSEGASWHSDSSKNDAMQRRGETADPLSGKGRGVGEARESVPEFM